MCIYYYLITGYSLIIVNIVYRRNQVCQYNRSTDIFEMARYSIVPYEIQKNFKNKCCSSITVNTFKKLTSLMKKHCICIILVTVHYNIYGGRSSISSAST